jgi:hypothetical protein
MNDTRARLIILLFGTPQVLEGTERGQNRSSNPYRVFSLRRGNDLHLVMTHDRVERLAD